MGALTRGLSVKVDKLQENLQEQFDLHKDGDVAYFNASLMRGKSRGREAPVLILSDYVGSQHSILEAKLKEHKIKTDTIFWNGEIELTYRYGKVVISAVNNSSGYLHDILLSAYKNDAAAYALNGKPDITNVSDIHLRKILEDIFPDLIDSETSYFPHSKDNEHLMKVEGLLSFDPKHGDALQSLHYSHPTILRPTEENIPEAIKGLNENHFFEFVDAVIKNMVVSKSEVNEWLDAVKAYNEFKLKIALYDYRVEPSDSLDYLLIKENWLIAEEAIIFITDRTQNNPDARYIILSTP